MVHLAPAWHLEVERGPGCLIVRLEPPQDPLHNWDGLAEHLWSLLEEQFTYRVVLDMQHVAMMNAAYHAAQTGTCPQRNAAAVWPVRR